MPSHGEPRLPDALRYSGVANACPIIPSKRLHRMLIIGVLRQRKQRSGHEAVLTARFVFKDACIFLALIHALHLRGTPRTRPDGMCSVRGADVQP